MSVDLSTRYLGLLLSNPLVASASPATGDVDQLIRLEQAGAAAAVLPSLFEETIRHEEAEIARLYDYQAHASPESLSYFPEMPAYNVGPERYLLLVRNAKKAVQMPIFASLNGVSPGGWTRHAKRIEEAGADALELNAYMAPSDPFESPLQFEERYYEMIASVRSTIAIPLAVKIGPYFSNLSYSARRMLEAGADGLVLFNRYLEPDVDVESLEVEPTLRLSTSNELRLPLRWLATLSAQCRASFAATSGVHTATDVVKALLVGADVVMTASALLKHGPSRIASLLSELHSWLHEHDYESVEQIKGSLNRSNCPNVSAFDRSNYAKALASYTKHP